MLFPCKEKIAMLHIVAALAVVLFTPMPLLAAGHGAEIFKAQGCRGCHQLQGIGGTIGPPLDGLGKRLDQKSLRQQLVTPKASQPASIMPAYGHLPPAELQALIDYLQGLK
jgi:mono/diheme cytochrome c family protein